MTIKILEFRDFEQNIKSMTSRLDVLAPEIGKVYVFAITRDGCSSCEAQKPKLEKLASKTQDRYGSYIVFMRIHINFVEGLEDESIRAKDLLGHYFYPTNFILLKTGDRGAFEYYRNVSPEMDELEKNILNALEIAKFFEKEKPS